MMKFSYLVSPLSSFNVSYRVILVTIEGELCGLFTARR